MKSTSIMRLLVLKPTSFVGSTLLFKGQLIELEASIRMEASKLSELEFVLLESFHCRL